MPKDSDSNTITNMTLDRKKKKIEKVLVKKGLIRKVDTKDQPCTILRVHAKKKKKEKKKRKTKNNNKRKRNNNKSTVKCIAKMTNIKSQSL